MHLHLLIRSGLAASGCERVAVGDAYDEAEQCGGEHDRRYSIT